MRILVTGAGGQLGLELARALAAHQAVLLDRASLDVTDGTSVAASVAEHRPDAVIHAAAWTDVDGCERDPVRAREVNERGARLVAEAAASVGAFLVVVSTDYVFDGTLGRPYVETDETAPLQEYGRSKLAGEHAAREVSEEVAIARTAWLYGRGKNFVTAILGAADRGPIDVVDDQVGSPTACADLAPAIVALCERRAAGVFHVANGGAVSRHAFAREIVRLAGGDPAAVRPIATADAPPRPALRPAYAPLEGRAWREAGFEPLRPWNEALNAALADIVAAR